MGTGKGGKGGKGGDESWRERNLQMYHFTAFPRSRLPLMLASRPQAGMAAGLGYGQSTVALIVTRGCKEMRLLAKAMGGRPETLAGAPRDPCAILVRILVACRARARRLP